MELDKLLKEGVLLVCQQIIKANTAANKDLFHTGNLPQLSQKGNIVGVICLHIFAGGGVQALASAASTLRKLLFAGRMTEVGGRTAHIVDVTLKCRVFHHQFRFF